MSISPQLMKKIRESRKPKHKFGAVRTKKDGINFPSKLERRYYESLLLRQQYGDVVFFLRQTSFDLPGGVRYVSDFQVFLPDGTVEFIDTKGRDTPMSIAKRKMVEELYPVTIKIVKEV